MSTKPLDDFKLIRSTNLQVENKKLKESLEDLRNRYNKLLCVGSDLTAGSELVYCDKNIHTVAEPIKNFSDSVQPGILSNPNESSSIPVIDLDKREENEIAKNNTAPV